MASSAIKITKQIQESEGNGGQAIGKNGIVTGKTEGRDEIISD